MLIKIRRPIHLIAIALVSAVVLTQFTNCGNYADPKSFAASSAIVSCDEDCIEPTTANLSVKPNLGNNGTEYSVPANLAEWNFGGDCNEGGFPYNTIRWELVMNGVKVRDSGMLGIAGNQPAHSRCVNGRFLLYINMSAINEDNVNRTGLANGAGGRSPYELYIEIYGQEQPTGTPQRNTFKGRTRVSLLPI